MYCFLKCDYHSLARRRVPLICEACFMRQTCERRVIIVARSIDRSTRLDSTQPDDSYDVPLLEWYRGLFVFTPVVSRGTGLHVRRSEIANGGGPNNGTEWGHHRTTKEILFFLCKSSLSLSLFPLPSPTILHSETHVWHHQGSRSELRIQSKKKGWHGGKIIDSIGLETLYH